MTDGSLRTAATPKRSFRDRMRTDWYLTRLDWHLEGLVPGRERKATLRELRQALAGDPRDTTAALADLGAPRTLARQYARESPLRPLWSVVGLPAVHPWNAGRRRLERTGGGSRDFPLR
jgi:hypothetical protein